tara:strand:- start:324 stop:527 length:204 start_codon:yes stop_codon:yes gene_type:complete
MVKLNFIQAIKIVRSKKDFIMYSVEGGKLVDFKLTNNLSKHRDSFNNQFKVLSDVQEKIKNNLKIEL